jgi:hypothetical protein
MACFAHNTIFFRAIYSDELSLLICLYQHTLFTLFEFDRVDTSSGVRTVPHSVKMYNRNVQKPVRVANPTGSNIELFSARCVSLKSTMDKSLWCTFPAMLGGLRDSDQKCRVQRYTCKCFPDPGTTTSKVRALHLH